MLTVILPVYNAESHLRETLRSILKQTYKDFRLFAINDGSTDASKEILAEFAQADSRVVIFSQTNRGLVDTLNSALENIETKYFCRHDADDVSHPLRFQKQLEFLERHADVGLLGTTFSVANGVTGKVQAVPLNHSSISVYFAYSNCFAHGSIMGKSNLISEGIRYSTKEEHLYVEDYELWTRMADITKVANLPELLYVYRDNPEGVSAKNLPLQIRNAEMIKKAALEKLTNLEFLFEELGNEAVSDPFSALRKKFMWNCLNHLSSLGETSKSVQGKLAEKLMAFEG